MSGTGYDDTVQFRAAVETNAADVVTDVRLGGINVSELAREGLKETLQHPLSDEEKIQIPSQRGGRTRRRRRSGPVGR